MPTEKETIDELTKQLKTANNALEKCQGEVARLQGELMKLKNAHPQDGVDLEQKNLRLDLDNVTRERDSLKSQNEKLKAQLLRESHERDAANRAKIISDLKTMGCTLSDKELNAMETDALDGLRDASRLFKVNQPSAGVKPFGDTPESDDPKSQFTVPDRFLASLKKGGI